MESEPKFLWGHISREIGTAAGSRRLSLRTETCTCNFRSRFWKVFINAALYRQTCRLGAAIACVFYARRVAPLKRTPETLRARRIQKVRVLQIRLLHVHARVRVVKMAIPGRGSEHQPVRSTAKSR